MDSGRTGPEAAPSQGCQLWPMHSGDISNPYQFESKGMADRVIENAMAHMNRLEAEPPAHLDPETVDRIFKEIPGLLPNLNKSIQPQ